MAAAEPTVGQLLAEVIKQKITPETASVVERFVDLKLKLDDREAERQFNTAFNAFQSELQAVKPDKFVPNDDKTVRYRFASYESIMEQVKPLLLKHGFAVSFSMDYSDGRVIQHCTLAHSGGHKRTNTFTARIGKGPPKSSETQGDGAAATYAKRFALCSALNITVESDTDGRDPESDGRSEGVALTDEQVIYLREQLKEVGMSEGNLLTLMGFESIEKIPTVMYQVCINAVEMKRRRAK